MGSKRSLGISMALVALFAGPGCYKLSSDCALNNSCETGGSGGDTTTSTTEPTGGTGGDTTTSEPTGATGGTGGTTDSGGTGGTTTPPVSCDPSVNAGPVAGDCGVFVSPAGDDANDGSMQSPLKTLTEAIARAALANRRVYACAGLWNEVVAVPPGITMYGGLQCDSGWAFSKDARSTLQNIDKPNEAPLHVSAGSDAVHIANFTVQASDATLTSGSSIAMIADNAVVELERCEVIAGNGQIGNGGASSVWDQSLVSALNGQDGVNACSPLPSGGAPVLSACGDFTSGQGGDGGNKSGANNGNGLDGGKGDGGDGGMGGNGQYAQTVCSSGGAGVLGGDGGAGDGGGKTGPLGAIDATGYHGAAGQPGVDGSRGTSGGGGGGSKAVVGGCNGAAGGSGGAGGCGGKAGSGGTAGGASIAILSLSSKLQFTEVHLVVGSGGKGGDGGNGQPGQFGGYGGHGGKGSSYNGSTLLKGCDGGDGGSGGKGGPGGGGAGGPTIGIAFTGAAPEGTPSIEIKGQPGQGGLGGILDVQKGGDGAPGVAAETYGF
ncbi:MAG: hypothetical protein U0441_07730 [Polyangiaceae bacterium]